MNNNQFIQVKTKANFEKSLNKGNINDISIAFIEDTSQIWTHGKYYSAIPENGKVGQFLTYTESGEPKWDYISNLENIVAYGVQFDSTVSDPHLTRIGNMDLHKSLPIQSQLKGCIAQANKVIYWLDESDWRFRKNPITQSVTLTVDEDNYTITDNTIFSTLQYEKQWIKIDNIPCQINSIDTGNAIATLVVNDQLKALSLTSGSKVIELGAVLNGYDGTVRVYCPKFYIKSETNKTVSKVWISEVKIDDTWTEQPEILVDAYGCSQISGSDSASFPSNMGYASTLFNKQKYSLVSVRDLKGYYDGGGITETQPSTTDIFRLKVTKPVTALGIWDARTYAQNAGSQLLSYSQYKNIFYWLYVIEYANFNCQEDYTSELTSEGYHQGGLGAGVTTFQYLTQYNMCSSLTPCGYGNELGNHTGIIAMNIPATGSYTPEQTLYMPRWRGFDNIFGDYHMILDGIYYNSDKIYIINYPENYATPDASRDTGYELLSTNSGKGISALYLNASADIMPKEFSGSTSEYMCDTCTINTSNSDTKAISVGGNATDMDDAGILCIKISYPYVKKSAVYSVDSSAIFRTVSTSVDLSSVSE